MPTVKVRHRLPELMDDPAIKQSDHHLALRGLQRINRLTNLANLVWPPLAELADRNDTGPLCVLDIATGGADLPIQLWQRAQRASTDLNISACDISAQAIEFAEENCQRAGAPIELFKLDVLTDSIPAAYDVVICSTFLHHLSDPQTELVLKKMVAAASLRVIVVDLVRSQSNYCQVWLACRLLSRSPVVHYDGPQSIRAAYTQAEIDDIADKSGIAKRQITSHWPCRFRLIGDLHDRL